MREHSTDDRLARLEGIEEIRRLVAEYSHGADKRDLERFLAVWHDDAVWDVGVARFRGRDEISRAIQEQWEAQPFMVHWATNVSIDLPLGAVRARVEVDAAALTALGTGEWLQSAGSYRDVLEIRDGRWGFVERVASVHVSGRVGALPARSG